MIEKRESQRNDRWEDAMVGEVKEEDFLLMRRG